MSIEAWTSEPPSEAGYFHFKRDGQPEFVLHIVPTNDGVTRELFFVPPWDWKRATEDDSARRSIHPIPSARELAALESLAATVRREIDAGEDCNPDNIDAALRALEEARRGRH